ncbi:hypothetical protein NC652_013506 [Populus alba x Populus x berolinensis]|uniref:Uncharacterized protein n=1 Tax=Populus alba x Populus x berolinensis TaxID=444605 RepID=A0AAD6QUI5_9ROSI|nr:hypothetical protein NC652_013506 [Populus alba x Populus x berolinensis]KAJ6996876.1 hypothetical protein NC653_013460 [Populus alba x Populus x berolinensis]
MRTKNKGVRTTRDKYYIKGGNIGREKRFQERETLSPRRLKSKRNKREEKQGRIKEKQSPPILRSNFIAIIFVCLIYQVSFIHFSSRCIFSVFACICSFIVMFYYSSEL